MSSLGQGTVSPSLSPTQGHHYVPTGAGDSIPKNTPENVPKPRTPPLPHQGTGECPQLSRQHVPKPRTPPCPCWDSVPKPRATPCPPWGGGTLASLCPQAKGCPMSLLGHWTVSPTVSPSCPRAKGSPTCPLDKGECPQGKSTLSSQSGHRTVSPSPKPSHVPTRAQDSVPNCSPIVSPSHGQGTVSPLMSLRVSPSQEHPHVPAWELDSVHNCPQAKSSPIPLLGQGKVSPPRSPCVPSGVTYPAWAPPAGSAAWPWGRAGSR